MDKSVRSSKFAHTGKFKKLWSYISLHTSHHSRHNNLVTSTPDTCLTTSQIIASHGALCCCWSLQPRVSLSSTDLCCVKSSPPAAPGAGLPTITFANADSDNCVGRLILTLWPVLMLPEAPQTRARTSRHEPAAHALHYGRPGGHPSRRTWRGVILAILSCSEAVLGGFLGVNWPLWHLEAYISSSSLLGTLRIALKPLISRDILGKKRTRAFIWHQVWWDFRLYFWRYWLF